MKKLLSLVLCKNTGEGLSLPNEETEALTLDENAAQNPKALSDLIKQAKGKYIVIIDTAFTVNDSGLESFLKSADENSADILSFDGGYALKAATVKGVPSKLYCDRCGAEIYTAFNSKDIAYVNLQPFVFNAQRAQYSFNNEEKLTEILEEFKRSKAKLSKTVYTFIFDILCANLITFYIGAMVAIKDKTLEAESLKEFDLKLKDNVVLYLALEKRFTAANLKKLREKDFKIGFLTYNKFKKLNK